MKCITVFYNIAGDDAVMDVLARCGVDEYSKFPRCQGRGRVSGARHDDHVWPSYNAGLVMVVPAAKAVEVMAALQAFRDGPLGRRIGIFAYQTPVDAVLAPPAGWNLPSASLDAGQHVE
ncbi:MAG: PG0541 family transporter-associated protein [Kiritimatiellia bacterium]|jgi:hypothetical protein